MAATCSAASAMAASFHCRPRWDAPGRGGDFFAVFRDLSQVKKGENELQQAQRLADREAGAKTDMLARITMRCACR